MEQRQWHPVIKNILRKRGIDTDEKIEEFFSPVPRLTYDPFLMKNMDQVCDRILEAVDHHEKICIYGDYDADGVTSVTLLMEFLSQLTSDLMYYIPSRLEEGYGLNDQASKKIAAAGVSLIITVDCGCSARKEVEYIHRLGMDIIVTDHHAVDPSRAPDCLMLDAKQPGETYPYDQLCGCGVAFKIAQALRMRKNLPKKNLNRCLDLVGIATVADVVSLLDENRTLVKYGLDRILKAERYGVNAILKTAGIRMDALNSYHIAFGIAPRINSAGRLSTADHGVRLLSSSDRTEAAACAETLENLNRTRRALQDQIYADAVKMIESEAPDSSILIYYAGTVNEGVTGIVAGKLKEHYYRPVIIVSDAAKEGFLKGTGRSVDGVDLFHLLNRHVTLFEKFGGHAAACGFTMAKDRLEEFRTLLLKDMEDLVRENPSVLEEQLDMEAVLTPDEISLDLAVQIQKMEPFGKDNERPLFEIRDLEVLNVYSMGAEKQYRKFQFRSSEGISYAVAFDTEMPGLYSVNAGDTLRICAEISVNTWNGRSSVQLIVRKIL